MFREDVTGMYTEFYGKCDKLLWNTTIGLGLGWI